MYVVQCPGCKHRLKVKQELHQAKVRCSKCSHIFLATTEELPDQPSHAVQSPPPAPPAKQPRPQEPPRAAEPAPEPAPAPLPARPAAPEPPAQTPANFVVPDSLPESDASPFEPSLLDSGPATKAEPKKRVVVRKKKFNWSMAIVIGLAVLLIPGIILAYYFNTTRQIMQDGQVRRVSNKEADRILQEAREPKVRVVEAPTPPARRGGGAGGSSEGGGTSGKPSDDSQPIEAGQAYESGHITAADVRGDEKGKIEIAGNRIIRDDVQPDIGYIVGEVESRHDQTLKTLELQFEILDENDSVIGRSNSITLDWVPPGALVPYSVTFNSKMGRKLVAVAKTEKAGESYVSWIIDSVGDCRWVTTDQKVTLNGNNVINMLNVAVKDIEIHVDFFTNEGILAGSTTAKLKGTDGSEKTGLDPDAKARFTAEFESTAGEKFVPTSIISRASVRLVGKK